MPDQFSLNARSNIKQRAGPCYTLWLVGKSDCLASFGRQLGARSLEASQDSRGGALEW